MCNPMMGKRRLQSKGPASSWCLLRAPLVLCLPDSSCIFILPQSTLGTLMLNTENSVGKCVVLFKGIQNTHMEPAAGAFGSAIKCVFNFPHITSLACIMHGHTSLPKQNRPESLGEEATLPTNHSCFPWTWPPV